MHHFEVSYHLKLDIKPKTASKQYIFLILNCPKKGSWEGKHLVVRILISESQPALKLAMENHSSLELNLKPLTLEIRL